MNYGFVPHIEGYLGNDNSNFDILIILREPHNKENEITSEFWLKDMLCSLIKYGQCDFEDTNNNRYAKRYINVLGRLVGLVTGEPVKKDEKDKLQKCAEKLCCCAFMNLSPFEGGESRTEKYYEVLAEFKKLDFNENCQAKEINPNSNPIEIAKNRRRIVQQFVKEKSKYIITTEDIFIALVKNDTVEYVKTESWLTHKSKVFYKAKIRNATVFSFYHPSHRFIKYSELEQ